MKLLLALSAKSNNSCTLLFAFTEFPLLKTRYFKNKIYRLDENKIWLLNSYIGLTELNFRELTEE